MLSSEAQQSLPQDAQVALQQVDNREPNPHPLSSDNEPADHLSPRSEILLDLCSCRLDARPVYSSLFVAYGRIRLLCALVG
jgi:hypothetical protein